MPEYIEREALLRHKTLIPGFIGEYVLVERIKEAPAADVEPVRRGEWLARARKNGVGKCCSACMAACTFAPMPYCPSCGAKMKG